MALIAMVFHCQKSNLEILETGPYSLRAYGLDFGVVFMIIAQSHVHRTADGSLDL